MFGEKKKKKKKGGRLWLGLEFDDRYLIGSLILTSEVEPLSVIKHPISLHFPKPQRPPPRSFHCIETQSSPKPKKIRNHVGATIPAALRTTIR